MENSNQNELNADKIVNELKKEIAALKKENEQLNEKIDELKYGINKYPNILSEKEPSYAHIIEIMKCTYC